MCSTLCVMMQIWNIMNKGQCCFCDMKDRAYFYVFKFYEKVIEVGGLK